MADLVYSAEEITAERASRELARRRLVEYSTYLLPWYERAPHIDLVAEYLEQVELFIRTKGKTGIGRLIVTKPPRTGKTEQVAKIFPSWVLGRMPDTPVIISSYGSELATESSRAVRDYVMSDRFAAVFGKQSVVDQPVQISDDSRSVSGWHLAAPHRGMVRAVGVGGGITGFGAKLLVMDDPFKNRDEAESESHRKRVMSWWRSSARTRIEDGGAIVIMHTRWQPEDLAGELTAMMASDDPLSDRYVVLNLPALAYDMEMYPETENQQRELMLRGLYLPLRAEGDPLGRKPGESIWPKKYSEEDYARTRANVGEAEWASLYQQLPRPVSGQFFDEADFRIVDSAPENLMWYRYVDLALGKTKRSDFNNTLAGALDEATGNLYLRDGLQVRQLPSFMDQVAAWMLHDTEKGVIWGFEDVNFQSLVLQEFMKRPSLVGIPMQLVKVGNEDKVTRARPVQTRAKQGKVFLVRGPWVQGFVNQALAFPDGKNDDWVDCASGLVKMIAKPRYVRAQMVRI